MGLKAWIEEGSRGFLWTVGASAAVGLLAALKWFVLDGGFQRIGRLENAYLDFVLTLLSLVTAAFSYALFVQSRRLHEQERKRVDFVQEVAKVKATPPPEFRDPNLASIAKDMRAALHRPYPEIVGPESLDTLLGIVRTSVAVKHKDSDLAEAFVRVWQEKASYEEFIHRTGSVRDGLTRTEFEAIHKGFDAVLSDLRNLYSLIVKLLRDIPASAVTSAHMDLARVKSRLIPLVGEARQIERRLDANGVPAHVKLLDNFGTELDR